MLTHIHTKYTYIPRYVHVYHGTRVLVLYVHVYEYTCTSTTTRASVLLYSSTNGTQCLGSV